MHNFEITRSSIIFGLPCFNLITDGENNGVFVKGYLCYKTMTSQNVSSEAQVKDFFILWKDYVPFSRYSSFCIFNQPMIYQICDVMMSIST